MSFCDRKCDLLDCKKSSPLWTVFRGCGHSYHLECLLPDLSVCKICEATLLSKVETLGKTANDAVLKNDTVNYQSDEDDDTSDDESCESNDEVESLYENEQPQQPQDVHILLQRIQLWQRPRIPQQ